VNSHTVQLFDTPQSLADAVARYANEGLIHNEGVLLITTPAHWERIRHSCATLGLDADAPRGDGRLTICDAEEVLAQLMLDECPDWNRFDAIAGTLVREQLARHGKLRVFGEAVDVLVRRNQLAAAATLEEHWNRLGASEPVTLFCSYSAEHFGNPRDAHALRTICELHTHVHSHPRDVLANFLLKTHAAC
jgi:hypothetical protein